MLYVSKKKDNKYGVVDTEDWAEEFYTKEELREIHKLGVKVRGITDTGIKVVNWRQEPEYIRAKMLGYKFRFLDVNKILCSYKPDSMSTIPSFCLDLDKMSEKTGYVYRFDQNNLIEMSGRYKGESLVIPCFVGKLDITFYGHKKITLSGGSGLVNLCGSFSKVSSDLEELDLRNLDVSNVEDMSYMISCDSLQSLTGLANWDVSNVKNMYGMFSCESLQNLNGLGNWNVSSVKNMEGMFGECINLQNINALALWNVRNVRNMEHMFYDCYKLQNLDGLRNWNVSNVVNMYEMFTSCRSIENIDGLKNWKVSKVKNMNSMFYDCSNLQNIDGLVNWNVRDLEDMEYMFHATNWRDKVIKNGDKLVIKK